VTARWRLVWVGLGAAGSAAAAWLTTPAGLQALGDFLVVRDAVQPADVVIVVSGDGTGERARTAARLVRQGLAPWLLVSGGRTGAAPGGAAAEMARVAVAAGVPPERVVVDDGARSTRDNARRSAALMARSGWTSAILVTSPYHTRRAAWVFRAEFLPRGWTLRVYAAEGSFFEVERWWTRSQARALVWGEYVKLTAWLLGLR
jgi:uncharacterized SAM-binding protein YcdF (DUF218 family)